MFTDSNSVKQYFESCHNENVFIYVSMQNYADKRDLKC